MNTSVGELPFLTDAEVRERITPDRARSLIERVLVEGFDPAEDPDRQVVPAGAGHLLLMPSVIGEAVGVKIASVTPGNPGKGLPRIQAIYVVMDAATLTPRLVLGGASLTSLRTPATTAVACDRLAAPDAERLLVFGSGPQAVEHVIALQRIRSLTDVRLIGRTPERTLPALEELAARGVPARLGRHDDAAEADIIVCATSSAGPVFDGALVKDGACVAAMGSHQPDRRELDGQLVGRSLLVVEERTTALREAGDVVIAMDEGLVTSESLHNLIDLVQGTVNRATDRPNLFKGTGMAWEDLAVASGLA